VNRWFEAQGAVAKCGNADRAGNVSSHTEYTASHSDESAFAATAASSAQTELVGVQDTAEDVVVRVGGHQGLGDVGLDVEDCSGAE
jgi:hypothetical protein